MCTLLCARHLCYLQTKFVPSAAATIQDALLQLSWTSSTRKSNQTTPLHVWSNWTPWLRSTLAQVGVQITTAKIRLFTITFAASPQAKDLQQKHSCLANLSEPKAVLYMQQHTLSKSHEIWSSLLESNLSSSIHSSMSQAIVSKTDCSDVCCSF